MPRRHRQAPSADAADDEVVLLDESGPGGDNAWLQDLVRQQLAADPVHAAHVVRSEAFYATQAVFRADRADFGAQMDELDAALADLTGALAGIEVRAPLIDGQLHAGAEVDPDDLGGLVAAQDDAEEASRLAFSAPRSLGFWLWPTEYGTDGSRKLVGMYDREGQLPEFAAGSAGVAPWIGWVAERRAALDDLLARADAVWAWAEERAGQIPGEASLVGYGLALGMGRPPELAASSGRESQFLVEVIRDSWPDWAVAVFERDVAELRRESEALDAGVEPGRIADLDALADALAALGIDDAVAQLEALAPAERRYVYAKLRGEAVGGDSAYADLLDEADGALPGVAGDPDGLVGVNTAGTLGEDMARGAPGAVANVGWGMVKSLPILGDVADWAVGDEVNGGIAAMNEALGMDADSSRQQAAIGQISGQIAGTIGLLGIGAPPGAEVAGAAAKVPAWLRVGLFGADTANGAYQAATGETVTGVALPWWSQVLAGVGVGVNGAQWSRVGKPTNVARADELVEGTRRTEAGLQAGGDSWLDDAIADLLPGAKANREALEAHQKVVRRNARIGGGLSGAGRLGPLAKTGGEGVDEEEERDKIGFDDLFDTLSELFAGDE